MACAASPAGNPNVIYAGGPNNGVSSGVIKTIDGGKHWTRTSKGLWDTRILGVRAALLNIPRGGRRAEPAPPPQRESP